MELMIGGVSASTLARDFGTPLYVYDENRLRTQMQAYREAFQSKDFDCHVAYASKAFCCLAMMQLVQQEGLWADVVSGGELYTAMKAGFNMDHILFHGNNKTDAELEMALEAGVGTIVCDNLHEAQRLAFLSQSFPHQVTNVLLRINPGVEAHTHEYIVTAHIDSKFGISVTRMDEICEIARIIDGCQGLRFRGFHSHIGSQIFDAQAFVAEIRKVCEFSRDFQNKTGIQIDCLDLGGGFPARYTDADTCPPVEEVCRTILSSAQESVKENSLNIRELIIEPGRSIAGEAGWTLYTVGALKSTAHREYVFVDGGMNDNIRPALYQAEYEADIVSRFGEPKSQTVTLAGKCCESGDIIARDIPLQPAQTGDILAVHTTGAYGQSMASNYNKLPVPGTVFVQDGKAKWVIRPQDFEDLIRREVAL